MKSAIQYATTVNEMITKSAKSIIEIGMTFHDAKRSLSKEDYKIFVTNIKYSKNSSSIRKWESIGEKALRLRSVADRLPLTWTTIYKIAVMNADDFETLIKSKVLNPDVTSAQIDELLAIKLLASKKYASITLKFDSQVDAFTFYQNWKELNAKSTANCFTVIENSEAKQLLEFAEEQQMLKIAA